MSGTREGGLKTAATIKTKRGSNWYQIIGAKGGSVTKTSRPKGFAANRALASKAGRKGGMISRRTK